MLSTRLRFSAPQPQAAQATSDSVGGYVVYHVTGYQPSPDFATNTGFTDISDAGIDHHWSYVQGQNVWNELSTPVTLQFDRTRNYYSYVHNAHWYGDQTHLNYEFLDAAGNVVHAIKGAYLSTFSMRFSAGPNLSSLTTLSNSSGNYNFLYGYFFFDNNKIFWRRKNWSSNPYGYTSPLSYEAAVSAPVTQLRLSGLRTYSTYANSGSAPILLQINNHKKGTTFTTKNDFFNSLSIPEYSAYNASCFSVSGGVLTVNDSTGAQSLTYTFVDGTKEIRYASIEYRVTKDGIGDAASFGLTSLLSVGPRRERLVDAGQRGRINGVFYGVKADNDEWLKAEYTRLDSETVKLQVSRVSTGEVLYVDAVTLTQTSSPTFSFSNGDGASYSGGMETQYRNLYIEAFDNP